MRAARLDTTVLMYPSPLGMPSAAVPFRARIVNTSRGAMELTLENVTGDWPFADEIAYVGTVDHPFLYVTRVRSTNAGNSKIIIAENDFVFDDMRIYCPHLFTVLPKFQRVQDVNGAPTVWKDYDLGPVALAPKVNVTGPFVAEVGVPATFTVSVINMEHGATGGAISAMTTGGTVNVSGNQLVVTWHSPGFRYLHVNVTDSAGIGRFKHPVFVSVDGRPAVLDSIVLTANRGWEVEVTLSSVARLEDTFFITPEPMGVAVVRVGDDWYYGFYRSCDMERDQYGESLKIKVVSSVQLLDGIRGHAFMLEDASRTSWYTLPGLCLRRAAHLLLEYDCTFNIVTPVVYEHSACELPIKSQAFHEGTVFNQLTSDLLNDAFIIPCQLPGGAVRMVRPPAMQWDRSAIARRTIRLSSIQETRIQKVGLVKAGGFAYDKPLLSRAPGNCPDYWSSTEELNGLICADQQDLNRLSGLYLARANAPEVAARGFMPVGESPMSAYPGISIFRSGLSDEYDVERVRISARNCVLTAEYSGIRLTPAREGETQTVPTEPEPTPIDWPLPPGPELPPGAGFGVALVRCYGQVRRTRNVYSTYPIWETIFDIDELESDYDASSRATVDFRYLERGDGVCVLLLTRNCLWLTSDIGADVVTWQRMLSRERMMALLGAQLHVLPYFLMTMVHSRDHIGMFIAAINPAEVQNVTYYLYTDDFGKSWRRTPLAGVNVYVWHVTGVANTAGTDEILAYLAKNIFGTGTFLVRSTDRGKTWTWHEDIGGTGIYIKPVKPWQYGVGGQIVYAQYRGFGVDVAAGKSVNGGRSYVSRLPTRYRSQMRGIEVWTFDPLDVGVVVWDSDARKPLFCRSRDGMQSWHFHDLPLDVPETYAYVELHGNPANRQEWTALVADWPRPSGVFIVQTLDGGLTWRSLMGNWYTIEEKYSGHDYLIVPPFAVVKNEDVA